MTVIPDAYRTNHRNVVSNILFVGGYVKAIDNVGDTGRFALRGSGMDFMVLPFRLDEILRNADHAADEAGGIYPFP